MITVTVSSNTNQPPTTALSEKDRHPVMEMIDSPSLSDNSTSTATYALALTSYNLSAMAVRWDRENWLWPINRLPVTTGSSRLKGYVVSRRGNAIARSVSGVFFEEHLWVIWRTANKNQLG